MPNNLVFNNVASKLQTTISGVDDTGTTQQVVVDDTGKLDIVSTSGMTVTAVDFDIRPLAADTDTVSIGNTVTVTAEDFDIRPLAADTDTVSIGNTVTVTAEDFDIRPLAADTDTVSIGNTVTVTAEDFDIRPLSGDTDSIQLSSRLFTSSDTALDSVTDSAGIFAQNTGEQNLYSFYVFNTGNNTLTVNLQISPTTTESYFMDDISGVEVVGPSEKVTLVATEFLQYTRLFYETAGDTATFEVYYNAHV